MHLSFLCILSAEIKTFYTLLNILHHLTDVSRWTWVSWFHHQFSSCICSRAEPRHWVCKPAYLMPVPIQDKWEGCGRKGIGRTNGGTMEVGHWLVRMEWHRAGWSVWLPLFIPCTTKSRRFLLAPAHSGSAEAVCVVPEQNNWDTWQRFLQVGCPSCHPTDSVNLQTTNGQHQSTIFYTNV